jgi:hypothetical protein
VSGGGNHLGNLVLACSICNGDEKREQPWEDFLRTKASGSNLVEREARIRAWFELHRREALPHSAAVEQALAEFEALVAEFGAKCQELKDLLKRPTEPPEAPG